MSGETLEAQVLDAEVKARFKPYPAYKPSGVEWLGDIPVHWEVVRLRRIFRVYNGATPNSEPVNWDGDIPWITPDDLGNNTSNYIATSARMISEVGYATTGTTMVPENSIILSTRAPIGHMAVTAISACTNQGCKSIVAIGNISTIYYYNYLNAGINVLRSFGQGSTFQELSNNNLKAFYILRPPLPEQEAIAEFLDRETGKIDALIEKKRRLLELLEEKRQAVISHAVTRGLDPSVPLKDSGIEWLGSIPEHWVWGRIRRFARIRTGGTPDKNNQHYWEDGHIPWIASGDVNQSIIYEVGGRITQMGLQESNANILPVNSVLIALNGQGKTKGTAAVLKLEACCNQSVAAIICDKNIVYFMYLYYYLVSRYKDIRGLVGEQRDGLNLYLVSMIPTYLPPLPEQEAIAEYLDRETGRLDALRDKINQGIERLQEYRTALISSAVTGKIDVRNHCNKQEPLADAT